MTSASDAVAPTDPGGTFVGKVHVVVEGEGPAVVLVHGIPGSVRDFRYLGPALAARGVCAVRVDMPGFGKTPPDAFPSTKPADRGAFLRQLMRALGHSTFAVGGHSFGGGAAILAAACFPDEVTALVCMNSIGPRRHRGFGPIPPRVVKRLSDAMDLPVVGERIHGAAARMYGERGLKSEQALTLDVVQHHMRVIGDHSFEELRVACPRVRCPALVVSADDDPLVEAACGFALARALSGAPLMTHLHTKRGGHFLQKHEAPFIARWLAARLAG